MMHGHTYIKFANISGWSQARVGDKTKDIYKDRYETKKVWREVCICLQEDFEVLGDVKKYAFGEYCHNLLNRADWSS